MNAFTFGQIVENYPCAYKSGRKAFVPYYTLGGQLRIATYKADSSEDPELISDVSGEEWFKANPAKPLPTLQALHILFSMPEMDKADREIYLNGFISRGSLNKESIKVLKAFISCYA